MAFYKTPNAQSKGQLVPPQEMLSKWNLFPNCSQNYPSAHFDSWSIISWKLKYSGQQLYCNRI